VLYISGDARSNENLHLTTMHLLWARQHNLVAGRLLDLNPSWDDERVFQEARRIVMAQLQHITYSEFLPVLLGWYTLHHPNVHPCSILSLQLHRAVTTNPCLSNNYKFSFSFTENTQWLHFKDRLVNAD
jgi:hypothetical protein